MAKDPKKTPMKLPSAAKTLPAVMGSVWNTRRLSKSTMATASFKMLSPNTRANSLGSTCIEWKMAKTVTRASKQVRRQALVVGVERSTTAEA